MMSDFYIKLSSLKAKLFERLLPLGQVTIQFNEVTTIENMMPVSGMEVLIVVNGKSDRYFIGQDQQGFYFNRFWNGVI